MVVRLENRLQGPATAHAAAHTTTGCVISSGRQGAGWETLNCCSLKVLKAFSRSVVKIIFSRLTGVRYLNVVSLFVVGGQCLTTCKQGKCKPRTQPGLVRRKTEVEQKEHYVVGLLSACVQQRSSRRDKVD